MDLLRLLEIDRSLIPPEAQRSLLIAEMTWSAAGSPQDRAGLGASLEKTLQSCTSQGIWYAPALLQPKKAIERGTWRPLQRAATRPGKQHAEWPLERHDERHDGAKAELPAADGNCCANCGGCGIVTAADGRSGTFCPCGAYLARLLKSLQQDAKSERKLLDGAD